MWLCIPAREQVYQIRGSSRNNRKSHESPTPGWQKHVNLSFMSLGLIFQLCSKSVFPEPGFIKVLVVFDVPSRG